MQNNENYSGFDLTMYNLFTLLREMYYTRGETETNFLQKSGGVLSGSLTIQGNLVINGQSYTIDTENLKVGDYTITLAKDNEQTLTSMVGMVVPKYDGTNYGFFGWDADGYAYVGDLTNYDGTSAITLANNSSLQRISTIDTTNTVVASNGVIYVYDATSHCFKKPTNDNKYYVIRNGAFVETELFTSEEKANINKSLYHLGAFDSQDGETRQTGYASIKDFTWEKTSQNRFDAVLPSAMPNGDTSIPDLVFSRTFTADTPNHVYSNVAENIATINSGKYFIVYVSATYYANHTAEQFVADYGDIYVQYKLESPYTESIIENEPLLNLDSNGCNFLREEWKKGLNLLQEDVYKNNTWEIKLGYVKLKANVTYNLWIDVAFPSGQRAVLKDGTKTAMGSNVLAFSNYTFAGNNYFTLANDYNGYLWLSGTFTDVNPTKAMLNEGTHPYPYEAYNGEIVHKADIEPVLLWENSSPTSNMSATTITDIKDMSKYKYIIIEYVLASGWASQFEKVKYGANLPFTITSNYNGNFRSRYLSFASSTSLTVEIGKMGNSDESGTMIPIAIYGTNVL